MSTPPRSAAHHHRRQETHSEYSDADAVARAIAAIASCRLGSGFARFSAVAPSISMPSAHLKTLPHTSRMFDRSTDGPLPPTHRQLHSAAPRTPRGAQSTCIVSAYLATVTRSAPIRLSRLDSRTQQALASQEVPLATTISTTVTINSAPADVWVVLCDLGLYHEWHPHIREATGTIAVGNRVTFRMAPPGRRSFTIRPTVIAAQPGAELRLLGRLPILFSGEHVFILNSIDSGTRTEVVQSESYRGLIVPFIAKTIASAQTEFDEVNHALKLRAEHLSSAM